MKKGWVYITTNKNKTVLYVGVTSDLVGRILKHKKKVYKGFTQRYNCDKLVYFEEFSAIGLAITREKQLKAGNRKRKLDLIKKANPEWKDLYEAME